MSKIKREFVSEWYDDEPDEQEIGEQAESSYRTAGKPTRAPYKRGSLEALYWIKRQTQIWRKKHGF